MKIVYSDGYFLKLGEHVFPAIKYERVKEQILLLGIVAPDDIIEPMPATDEEVLLVHAPSYVGKLRTGGFSPLEAMRHEVPYSRALVEAFYLAAGGTIRAGRLALEEEIGVNLGGGFHHAFAEHGEGFC